ncbi:MAG: SurA N-terminal domain-containing protein [Treponema sp.]|nr:SurA N-terminal domain-containing protein [Treponema sp.]
MAKKDKKDSVREKESASEAISKKFKQSPGIYIGSVIVLVLITITFIGGDFLSGGGFGGSDDDFVFGYYDNIPISWVPGNMFSQFYEQSRQRIQSQAQSQGIDINDFRVTAQIWRSAYEQTVVHSALLHMVSKSNYKVPEKSVDRAVAQLPQFQNNGRFSSVLYNQMSESRRHNLWRQTQDELAINMFVMDFFGFEGSFGLLIPQGEADFIGSMIYPMRSFEMVSFRIDDYPESEYLSFAQDNTSLFNSIHMSKITITSSERDARRVLASIKDGTATFEDAAIANSQDGYADRGGDMGNRFVYELDIEIPGQADRNVIFGLRRGEISDVIAVSSGWAVFRIENEMTPPDFDDYAVMDRVRSYVRNVAGGRMEDWAISQAQDFIDDALESGFDNAARWRNMERRNFGPLPINYAGVDLFPSLESFTESGISAQELSSIARNENFWKIAFSTEINVPSQPLVQGNNVFVFHPLEYADIDESYMENIASIYKSYWVNFIAEQSLQQYFINSDKMSDDQFFWDAYFRYIMP